MDEKYFKTLEITNDATVEEVQQAYRDLAQIWHPDSISSKNPRLRTKAVEKMKALNEARDNLIDFLTEKQERIPEEGLSPNQPVPTADKSDSTSFFKFLVISLSALILFSGIYFFFRKSRDNVERAPADLSLQGRPAEGVPEHPVTNTETNLMEEEAAFVQFGQEQAAMRHGADTIPVEHTKEASKQMGIHQNDDTISETERRLTPGEYTASKKHHASAIKLIDNGQNRKENLLLAREQTIERGLSREDIVYGSQGVVRDEDEWIAPDLYQKNYVAYKGRMRHYTELKDIITQITDPEIGIYLIHKYRDKNIRHKKLNCYHIELYDKNQLSSHFKVSYQWEIWTFTMIENGLLSLDIAYNTQEDRWRVGDIREAD